MGCGWDKLCKEIEISSSKWSPKWVRQAAGYTSTLLLCMTIYRVTSTWNTSAHLNQLMQAYQDLVWGVLRCISVGNRPGTHLLEEACISIRKWVLGQVQGIHSSKQDDDPSV